MLISLIYVSEETIPFSDEAITELAEMAWHRNKQYSITGYLYYENGRFLQYLEGEEGRVLQLFENICNDATHKVIRSAKRTTLKYHLFFSWHMRRLSKKELREINLEKIIMEYMMVFVEAGEEPEDSEDLRIWKTVTMISKAQWKMSGNLN